VARSSVQKSYFNFVGGLVTEASPLTSPPNTLLTGENFDLRRDGSLIRRRGIDVEIGVTTPAVWSGTTAHTISIHEWRSVAGDGGHNRLLVQYDKYLHIEQLDADVTFGGVAPSIDSTAIGGVAGTNVLDLSLAAIAGANVALDKVQVATGKGAAFICGPNIHPLVMTYDAATATYVVTYVGGTASNILVRDFAGLTDGLAVDSRPTALTPAHDYNLLNQGWTPAHIITYFGATGTYPSNSDIWWHGRNSTGDFTPAELNKIWFGAIQAPKGHFLYSAFDIVRSTYVATVQDQRTNARPSVVSFYGGRVWYSGIASAAYNGTVLFSRLIEDPAVDAHKCYMDADPTSEVISDLVASDGGTITIPEAGQIIKLHPLATGILVFAQNGVWIIKGTSSTGGFAATAFSVDKITNIGTSAPESVVEVEGTVFYVARSGVYNISMSSTTLNLAAVNISQTTIQKKIVAISDAAFPYIKGSYDPLEREVKWVYSENLNPTYKDACDRGLVFDIVLKAFYTFTVAGTLGTVGVPMVMGTFMSLPTAQGAPRYETMIRFVTLTPGATTVSLNAAVAHDNRMVDWWSSNNAGYNYISFFDTGYELHQDAMRDKQIDEVHFFFKRTERTVTNGVLDNQSGCQMSYKFDWADDPASGQYTTPQQAYYFARNITIPNAVGTVPFTSGHDVVATKHDVRGSGRAFQLHIESEQGKDMHLLGWAVFASGVAR